MEEFHELWSKESLPLWEKYGAKHIGSWSTVIGRSNEIVRLFAFKNLAHYERFRQLVQQDKDAQAVLTKFSSFLAGSDIKCLLPAAYSPLR
ncbi:NIPSNAP family protein [Chloroflexota bacterium]